MEKKIELTKAKFSSRIFSFGADLVCMAVTSLLMVIGMQYLVSNSSGYREITNTLDTIQMQSHLYARDGGEVVIVTKAYDAPEKEEEYKELNAVFDQRLKEFYADPAFFDQTNPESGMHLYDIQRIPEGQTHTDLFVKDEHGVVVESLTASYKDLYKFYANAINQDAVAHLMKNDAYMNANRSVTYIFVFIELLIPIAVAVLIFEFIIPAFDKHGKRTLGKRIFKLGVVDSRGLSPKFGRFVCRFLLFAFAELALSVVSFLIPIIISFSMVAFGKGGQSFHDYVCATYVVDASQDFIHKDEKEYEDKINNEEKYSLLSKDLKIK